MRLHTSIRARLFVEHLEDRAQPTVLQAAPMASLLPLNPGLNPTPAILGDSVAGSSIGPAIGASAQVSPQASPGTDIGAGADALIILFGPDDVAEFAVLVEPRMAPGPVAESGLAIESLLHETDFRVIYVPLIVPSSFDGFADIRGIESQFPMAASNPHESDSGSPPINRPTHSVLDSDTDPLLIPAGYVAVLNRAQAPMPRAVEAGPMPVEVAPPPHEAKPSEQKAEPKPSTVTPPTANQSNAPGTVKEQLAVVETLAAEPPSEPASAEPAAADVSLTRIGTLAAAISACGYWLLHHSPLARTSRLSPNPSLKPPKDHTEKS